MEMNDNTILRIKVPAHLYEAVKAQLTLKEAKQNFGTKDMKPVKGQKAAGAASDKPKAAKPAAPKKANAPQKAPGAYFDKETEKMGAGMTEKKELGLDELKSLAELLNGHIAKLEEKTHAKAEKAPVEEARDWDAIQKQEKRGQTLATAVKDALSKGLPVIANGKNVRYISQGMLFIDGENTGMSLSKVTSLNIGGEDVDIDALVAQASQPPQYQDVSQEDEPQWDWTAGPMGGGKLD